MIKFELKEIYPVVEITAEYLKTYKLLANNEFMYMLRFLSTGDGKLNIIINNFDIKIKFIIIIEKDILVDKIYYIEELYNILRGMRIYPSFDYYEEDSKLKFNDDAEFVLKELNLDPAIRNEVFGLEEKEIKEEKNSELNEFIENELNSIKKILSLKNNTFANAYSYEDDNMLFNFYDVYIKKNKTLKLINSDIISLQFLIFIFSKYNNNEFSYGINENKFVFKNNSFYIEGHNIELDTEKILFINTYFNNFKEVNKLNLKVEFANFVSTVVNVNKKTCLIFDDNIVRTQAEEGCPEFNAEFKIDFTGFFIIKTITLLKVLNFMIKYSTKLDSFELSLGETDSNKWIKVVVNDVIIMTEIAADLEEIKFDEFNEKEEVEIFEGEIE